ncbi:MAG: hypothetical protein WBX16_03130 [Candidatus Acidiferrales bacterium]
MTEVAAMSGGKIMRPLGLALALVIVGSAPPAYAGASTNVKCAANEDRVWVYENLDDFNLAAKLKCGDPVQVESRVKGYVKIQTADGTEGYVLDSALPKSALPPAPEEKPITVEAASLAFAAKRAAKSATPTVSSAPTASTAPAAVVASSTPAAVSASSAPAVASTSTAPAAVAVRITPAAPAAPASTAPVPAPAPVQPAVAVSVRPLAPVAPAPAPAAPASAPVYVGQSVSTPAPAPAVASTPAAPSVPTVAHASSVEVETVSAPPQPAPAGPTLAAKYSNPQPSAPAPPSVPTVAHASSVEVETISRPPQPAPAAPTVDAKYSNPQPIVPARAKKHKTPPRTEPAVSATQPTVVAEAPPATPPSVARNFAATPQTAPTPSAAPMVASNVQPNENASITENSASIHPVSTPADQPTPARAKPPVNPDDDDDTAVHQLEEDTANCTHYFSAYGLSPNQYKWLAQNRRKAFPSVCPAPTPAMVDFVVIFTHDVAFYSVTMPDAIHVEQNGFSDWTPLTTVDTALMTPSEADKSHHEYVWVFHTTRGAFDPSKFSSHRRPLYSKAETNTLGSRGGFRTVMDALTFIEQNGTNR